MGTMNLKKVEEVVYHRLGQALCRVLQTLATLLFNVEKFRGIKVSFMPGNKPWCHTGQNYTQRFEVNHLLPTGYIYMAV
jgi:hypothetical protein